MASSECRKVPTSIDVAEWQRVKSPDPKQPSFWFNIKTKEMRTSVPEEISTQPATLQEVQNLQDKMASMLLIDVRVEREVGTKRNPATQHSCSCLVMPGIHDHAGLHIWRENVPIDVTFSRVFKSPPIVVITPIMDVNYDATGLTCAIVGLPTKLGFRFCFMRSRPMAHVGVAAMPEKGPVPSSVLSVNWIAIAEEIHPYLRADYYPTYDFTK